jgi:hypothetical protein
VLLLSRLHHKNLVRLEGFCEEKQILVYEYMKLGNLHSHLFSMYYGSCPLLAATASDKTL